MSSRPKCRHHGQFKVSVLYVPSRCYTYQSRTKETPSPFREPNCRTSPQGVLNHPGPSLPYVVAMASLSTHSQQESAPGPAFSSLSGMAHGITTASRSCFSQLPGRVGSACPLFGFSRHRWRAWLPLLESASLTVILLRTSSLGN